MKAMGTGYRLRNRRGPRTVISGIRALVTLAKPCEAAA